MKSSREKKKQLRQALRDLRASQQEGTRASKNAAIREKLLSLPQFQEATRVFSYISYGAEVDTHAIIDACQAAEKQVFVPLIAGPSPMQAIRFPGWAGLVPGPLGILNPVFSTANTRTCDITLAPGLAFTAHGGRLGYGRGYYDNWLRNNDAGFKIALAYELQLLAELPLEDHDIGMDMIVTEERIIRA